MQYHHLMEMGCHFEAEKAILADGSGMIDQLN